MDVLSYFRVEVETVGRHWRDLAAGFSDAEAFSRPAPNMNHALWLSGHMIWAEDYLIVEVPTGQAARKKDWDALFDHSSEKLPAGRYPPFREVCAEYARVHAAALARLDAMTAADLGKPSALEPRWFPTAAHAISHQVTHGHYHLGQLAYLDKLRQAGRPG